ncbi:MAG: proline dehydrogenase [Dehalococcoidia bacterium]|nr:proline dehydrogenase [Dehalococcoidia bacterium]
MSLMDKLIGATVPLVPKPLVRHIAASYIAGETLDEQVLAIKELNGKGFMVASSILGEDVTEKSESVDAVQQYEEVLVTIASQRLNSNIHVKLTHLGLNLDKEFCYNNVKRLLEVANSYGNFVRIDMEESPTTDDTFDVFFRLNAEFENVGCVVQACLRRTVNDVQKLAAAKANVRICKGIYIEPREIAYLDRGKIRENYAASLAELLTAGCYVGIATHDKWLVDEAFRIIGTLDLDPFQYEFQMLHGVDPELRESIIGAGHRLRVAVPFGPRWYPYSVRRLRKNPRIARYVLQALLTR